jgi:RNA polymerase sigma-70 factor (ECF subfamily)
MAEGVRALTDGGSEFLAAKVPVVGRSKVAFMFLKLTRQRQGDAPKITQVSLNGLPALLFEYPSHKAGVASRVVLRCEVGADGLISEVHSVLATAKLSSLRDA